MVTAYVSEISLHTFVCLFHYALNIEKNTVLLHWKSLYLNAHYFSIKIFLNLIFTKRVSVKHVINK